MPKKAENNTQLVVQLLPEGLMTRVRKYCNDNGIYIRRFVAEALELGLQGKLGKPRIKRKNVDSKIGDV